MTLSEIESGPFSCLFFTGRQHAGESLDALLVLRDAPLPTMLWMSNARWPTRPKRYPERVVVDLNCLVHARRQFVDIHAFFPAECAHIIAARLCRRRPPVQMPRGRTGSGTAKGPLAVVAQQLQGGPAAVAEAVATCRDGSAPTTPNA